MNTLLDYQIDVIGLKSGITALDAGCGVCGPAVYFAQKTGCRIEAITISGVQAEKAREHIAKQGAGDRVNVREGDYHTLEQYYPENSMDAVYFLESFGHAKSHEQALDSAWKVLKPGGVIYIKDLFIKKAALK
ncbi:MAG: methyltransferase domain-containing protein, partial [Bacteroidia bacterium]|nr:methyltransferase domain-containing protein [Bacteroidia bacterium]